MVHQAVSEGETLKNPVLYTALPYRELSLQKGDIVYIHKEVDKNWLEGEHHGRLGIFPANYVEVSERDGLGETEKLQTPGFLQNFEGVSAICLECPRPTHYLV